MPENNTMPTVTPTSCDSHQWLFLTSHLKGALGVICAILIAVRLLWLVTALHWKYRCYMWKRFPSDDRSLAAESSASRKSELEGAEPPSSSDDGQNSVSVKGSACQCQRMQRMVFVTAVMEDAGETRWRRRVVCPKCRQQTPDLLLVQARILDEDACQRYPECYCRKTACLLVALETYPEDYLICLDQDVVLDDTLVGNICASPLHEAPAWFSICTPERPVEPSFLNAMIIYFFTLLQVITVQLAYTRTPILVGKFMILHAPFFHACFTLRELERIWGRAISEDYRLATILNDRCRRSTRLVEWPVYTRTSPYPATFKLLWSKTRRWMQGTYSSMAYRLPFCIAIHKPLMVLMLWCWGILDSATSSLCLYAALFVSEALSVALLGNAVTLLRLLQVLLCTAAWELILPYMYIAWNAVDRFTWYRHTYIMSRFDDEILSVIDQPPMQIPAAHSSTEEGSVPLPTISIS